MHDDDNGRVLNTIEAAALLRKEFDEFVTFTANELAQLVLKHLPNAEVGGPHIDPAVYAGCHRLVMSGLPLGQRVMAVVADSLSIAAT